PSGARVARRCSLRRCGFELQILLQLFRDRATLSPPTAPLAFCAAAKQWDDRHEPRIGRSRRREKLSQASALTKVVKAWSFLTSKRRGVGERTPQPIYHLLAVVSVRFERRRARPSGPGVNSETPFHVKSVHYGPRFVLQVRHGLKVASRNRTGADAYALP